MGRKSCSPWLSAGRPFCCRGLPSAAKVAPKGSPGEYKPRVLMIVTAFKGRTSMRNEFHQSRPSVAPAGSDTGVRCRIAVLAHVGMFNLGDELLVASVLQNVRRLRPDADFCVFGMNPDDTRARHGVESFRLRPRREAWSAPSDEEVASLRARAILRKMWDRLTEGVGLSAVRSPSQARHHASFVARISS